MHLDGGKGGGKRGMGLKPFEHKGSVFLSVAFTRLFQKPRAWHQFTSVDWSMHAQLTHVIQHPRRDDDDLLGLQSGQ